MTQLNFLQAPSWTVSDITRYLRQMMENDLTLQDAWVMGEVSNYSPARSGHIYFTLKDAGAAIKVVMWKRTAERQEYLPSEGHAVEVHGSITIYEANGVYQLYADQIRPTGEGRLYQEFLRLKARLEAEGLFSEERKRPIPRWPGCIGVITSPTGAALRDILNTLRRRYPLARVVLAPTLVQGDEAPTGIVAALEAVCRVCNPDVVLLARGGGSVEDLWAFNDERVARAVAASPVPVISGVGHETDFTICDFAADLRAPTPTAAAELATPNRFELQEELADVYEHLLAAMQGVLDAPRWELNDLRRRLEIASPRTQLRSDRQRIDELNHRAERSVDHSLAVRRLRLHALQQRLAALNPTAVLQRGYALVRDEQGRLVRSVGQVRPGDAVSVHLIDGQFGARVSESEPD